MTTSKAVERFLDGTSGRLRAIEIEFDNRHDFEQAVKLIGTEATLTTYVASGDVDGVEVVLVLSQNLRF
jgi:hypothetical protein